MRLVNRESFPACQNLISKNVGALAVDFQHKCKPFQFLRWWPIPEQGWGGGGGNCPSRRKAVPLYILLKNEWACSVSPGKPPGLQLVTCEGVYSHVLWNWFSWCLYKHYLLIYLVYAFLHAVLPSLSLTYTQAPQGWVLQCRQAQPWGPSWAGE